MTTTQFVPTAAALWVGLFLCAGFIAGLVWYYNWAQENVGKGWYLAGLLVAVLVGLPLSLEWFKWAWRYEHFWPSQASLYIVADTGAGAIVNFFAFCAVRLGLLLYLVAAVVLPPLVIFLVVTITGSMLAVLARRQQFLPAKARVEPTALVATEKIVYVDRIVPGPPIPPPRSARWKHRIGTPPPAPPAP